MIGRGGVESVLKYHAVGFDLSHALLRYRIKPFVKSFYEAMCVFLVNHCGYPPEVFPANEQAEQAIFSMFFRAVFDHSTGFLLKISCTLQIMRAFFGIERVADEEILRLYGSPPALEDYSACKFRGPAFTALHNYSLAAQSPLLAQVIELRKAGNSFLRAKDFAQIAADIGSAADYNLRIPDPRVFATQSYPGYFYPEFLAHPRRYLHPVSPAFLARLRALRKRGLFPFIASNAPFPLADILLRSTVGPDWPEFFSFAIFEARMPDFFDPELQPPTPFRDPAGEEVNFACAMAEGGGLRAPILRGGHVSHLNRHFFAHVNKNFRAAFCSDTIVVDGMLAYDRRMSHHWDAIFILEELQELEEGMPREEYYDSTSRWGSALVDRNLTHGGLEPTTLFYFADKEARRSFSKLDAPDCLDVFDI